MNLRFIFGDQLSTNISSLSDISRKTDVIFMCEVHDEARYVKHHKKKIAFIFSAMRHFAEALRNDGYVVDYTKLGDPDNAGSFRGELERAILRHSPARIILTEPSEYRVLRGLKNLDLGVEIEIRADRRFLCTHDEFTKWARGRKQLRMEYFYREMRKKYGILMDGDRPAGGQWNYDAQNRKPAKTGLKIPHTYVAEPDAITREVMELVAEHFANHFGDLEPFVFAVTREQAVAALQQFIAQRQANFGDYQDAMIRGEPWMYHSHLSFYINCGLLLPMECVQAAEQAFRMGKVPLNAAEGFIRQIIGWREYVRGVYWLHMPDYAQMNFLGAQRKLPALYWGGDTQMNCMRQCVKETKENAYAHHIQRLMVLGNLRCWLALTPMKSMNGI